jgi:ribonuclease HI
MGKKVNLIFDGGSRGNPGIMFGSFMIEVEGNPSPPIRLRMGHGTNNEAEYLSLLSGLETTIEMIKAQKIPLRQVDLVIRGDSQLVINQLSGAWKATDPRMRTYRDQAKRYLKKFGSAQLVHQPRNATVQLLGHMLHH